MNSRANAIELLSTFSKSLMNIGAVPNEKPAIIPIAIDTALRIKYTNQKFPEIPYVYSDFMNLL